MEEYDGSNIDEIIDKYKPKNSFKSLVNENLNLIMIFKDRLNI